MSMATHYQTVSASEEQHLAAMSSATTSSATTSVKTTKVKTTKKVSSKKLSSSSSAEIAESKASAKMKDLQQQQQKVLQQETHRAEESVVSQEVSTTTVAGSVQQKSKVVKKKLTAATSSSIEQEVEQQTTAIATTASTIVDDKKISSEAAPATNGKKKAKKSKKSEAEKENISVKSSFSKFDALQKKNLIHGPQTEKERNCRICSKSVYKMEEIKAEKSIYHKNCFRCHECDKQLKVDNYQSHEGVLYCTVHFKLLFAPKCVEDSPLEKPRKPELIIRENQPEELPPDVVRASDKPDLGLEELQQLNLRSKFQVFENGGNAQQQPIERSPSNAGVKRSSSILTKMAKLQARGFTTGVDVEHLEVEDDDNESAASSVSDSEHDHSESDGDRDLVRSRKRTQRERPVGLGHAMSDIKTKFENGHVMSKEERREERKQEIQSIRSRLFMGKQARIKEMYQQAVADSEQAVTSSGKKLEVEVGDKARSLKERFEKGAIFKDGVDDRNGCDGGSRSAGIVMDEADVFESAISKNSRSIFMELDANAAAGKNQTFPLSTVTKQQVGIQRNRSWVKSFDNEHEQEKSSTFQQENVVKHDEKQEDIKIETSEISSKFKFFETYRPAESQKKEFRITPPREGVVKLPDPEAELEESRNEQKPRNNHDEEIIGQTHTASMMLNKFRELEQRKDSSESGPRPLKCFTPPPDGGRRLYQEPESDAGSEEYDDEEGEEEEEEEEEEVQYRRSQVHLEDEALKEAQAAARAKQLRAKFEKWEANEIQREVQEGRVNVYSEQVSDDTNIESTKSIRERFENMKTLERESQARPRHQVNRFV